MLRSSILSPATFELFPRELCGLSVLLHLQMSVTAHILSFH